MYVYHDIYHDCFPLEALAFFSGTRPPVYLSQQRVGSHPERFQALAPVTVSAFLEAISGGFQEPKPRIDDRFWAMNHGDLSIKSRDFIGFYVGIGYKQWGFIVTVEIHHQQGFDININHLQPQSTMGTEPWKVGI